MKSKIQHLSSQLLKVHRRLLENERLEAEKSLERALPPLAFLSLLTSDPGFTWLQPFSALIAELDAFVDESETVTDKDLQGLRQQIEEVLYRSNPRLVARYQHYIDHDPEFIPLHAGMLKVLQSL